MLPHKQLRVSPVNKSEKRTADENPFLPRSAHPGTLQPRHRLQDWLGAVERESNWSPVESHWQF